MATRNQDIPDMFPENELDPVESATGYRNPSHAAQRAASTAAKKKAGFYLSVEVLERFNLKYHELKLAGVAVDNKSTLLELALSYALDDLDKGSRSRVLRKLS